MEKCCYHLGFLNHSYGKWASQDLVNCNQDENLSYTAVEALKEGKDLDAGKHIQKTLRSRGKNLNLEVADSAISMYSRFGDMIEARDAFERMQHRDLFSWTSLISGYAKNGDHQLALQLFSRMQQEGFKADRIGYLAALKACANSALCERSSSNYIKYRSLARARVLHSQVSETGYLSDRFVASSLVNAFGKCGSMVEARSVFDGIPNRDAATWNSLVLGYAECGESDESLKMFQLMQDEGLSPNPRTYLAALKACINQVAAQATREVDEPEVKQACLGKGKAIHRQLMKQEYESDVFVASALVDLYSRCGSVEDAEDVFSRMTKPTMWSWNAMILGYAEAGDDEAALELFHRFQRDGLLFPDARTYVAALKACGDSRTGLERGFAIHARAAMAGLATNPFVESSLVEMYSRCGSMNDAFLVFSKMRQRTSSSWSWMIQGHVENGDPEQALSFFSEWQAQTGEDSSTAGVSHCYVAAFKACSIAASGEKDDEELKKLWLERGMAIHSEMNKRRVVSASKNSYVGNTLIVMYSRCGCILLAREIFNCMGEHRTVVSWSSMILGYTEAGDPESALHLYRFMEKSSQNNSLLRPNRVTHFAVLKACGSLGDLQTGREMHARLLRNGEFDQSLDAATWLVDFYGRCGRMEKAELVFNSATVIDSVAWNALIGGYSRRADVKKVREMVELMTGEGWIADAVTGICMAAADAHAGVMKRVEMMKAKNVEWRCLVDGLGRAGFVEDAVKVVEMVRGLGEERRVWRSLLGASRRSEDAASARLALSKLVQLDSLSLSVLS